MARAYKIKRNHRIYRTRRFSVTTALKWFMVFLLGAGLIFFGFSIAGPVLDFLTGKVKTPQVTSSSEQSSVLVSSSSESSSSQPTASQSVKGVSVSMEILTDATKLDAFIKDVKNQGVNAVTVTLKDDAGLIYYPSALPKVSQFGALAKNSKDLSAGISKLKENNLKIIGEITAFQDMTAAYGDRAMAVKYQNTETLWLDNFQEKGGKPWLNPYNAAARAYIASIASEAAGLGIDAVMVRGIQFPTGATEVATYPGMNGATKEQALKTFVEELKSALSQKNAQLIVEIPAAAAAGNMAAEYSASPLALYGDYLAVDMRLSQMSNGFKIGSLVIPSPTADPFGVTDALLKKILPEFSPGSSKLIVLMGTDGTAEQQRAITSNQIANTLIK